MHVLTEYLAQNDIEDTFKLPTSRKWNTAFKLEYLHLTLANFKGQCHTHFNCEYLANGDR